MGRFWETRSLPAARGIWVGEVAAACRLRPDVALMDVHMAGMDGVSATRQLLANKPASTRIIVLTTFDVDSYIYDALRAGTSGFLLKNVPPRNVSTRSASSQPVRPCSTGREAARHGGVFHDADTPVTTPRKYVH